VISARWNPAQMGDWAGRRVVITGANSGIGLEAARLLVEHGASIVMACRDVTRGEASARSVTAKPQAGVGGTVVRRLDLADQASVRDFAAECVADDGPIYALVNNAGVMACPLSFTTDGLEMQMGTNHFGHALLTSLLLPKIDPNGRVVIVSSIAARGGHLGAAMTAEDLTSPVPYAPQAVYSNTKQANLLFAQEWQRRLTSAGSKVAVVGVHPGVSATELFLRQMRDSGRGFIVPVARPFMKLVFQSAAAGSWPTLRGLSDPGLTGGEFVGPRHLGQSRGVPELLKLYPQGADTRAAARLWELTEEILSVELLGTL
jgi:NAD(P)-dependent dehydrogenase (short-subunit alcohol dehydrogenase family)